VPLVKEELGEVRADEAGTPGDQRFARHRRGRVPVPPGEPCV
jgi:hypothetical protein